ncbi:putative allantoate permease [Lophiostoma macrostomum CBS 122681]|uniref:Putative allantoate permease n=1 Tax=Lophiostoma macrostomum CBS 122681 TaxID=1314788 RepID=A0A6A6SPA1_9PLEO|nr:putative allantoate permease [Lophiostoma macrostomum CBS 122681]
MSTAVQLETGTELSTSPSEPIEQTLSDVEERKLIRRIDLRLLPILTVVYITAFLDRVNISNALTMGLPKDLHLKGDQPNIALAVFFVPYIIFEIPSNLLLKRLKPHRWLSMCTIAFGVAMLAQGFVKNFAGLLTTRMLLGLAETGMFPGSFYLISFWYKQEESQKRFTTFWTSLIFAGAFGGLLASAIAEMDGVGGLRNWRWIFILEGIGTIIVGGIAFFLIPDFPEDASWLSRNERQFVQNRIGRHNSSSTTAKQEHTSPSFRDILKEVGLFFTNPMRILGAFMYWVSAYAYFAPTIIKNLGYSVVQTQLRSVIPFATALVACLLCAWLSDLVRLRLPFVLVGLTLACIGLIILMTVHHNIWAQFAALCLFAMGVFSAGICVACWYIMNLQGHSQRAIGTAWMISMGNTGGILATFTFVASDAPRYTKGYGICIGALCVSFISSFVYAGLILKARKSKKSEGVSAEDRGHYSL